MSKKDRREYFRRYYAANAEKKRASARERIRRQPKEALVAAQRRYYDRERETIKVARALAIPRKEAREMLRGDS